MEYKVPVTASWTWKQIVMVKDALKSGFDIKSGKWSASANGVYSLASAYGWITHDNSPRLHWITVIWTRWNIPKTCIITWLAVLNRLQISMCKIKDKVCTLCCQRIEDRGHLL